MSVRKCVDVDPRDLAILDKALDALESLHDAQAVGDQTARKCLCGEASSWRQARAVLNHYKARLGLKIRLLDQI